MEKRDNFQQESSQKETITRFCKRDEIIKSMTALSLTTYQQRQ